MKIHKMLVIAMTLTSPFFCTGNVTIAGERWQEKTFPPPNGGLLVFTITAGGNAACASYDGANCLWGQKIGDIDFTKVKPLVCGAAHRKLYGVTGFEDPNHWCNLALRTQTAAVSAISVPNIAKTPTIPSQPADGYRMTDWSNWGRVKGIEYRFRVRWNPANSGTGKTVDTIYQVRNTSAQQWSGAARSLDCTQNTLWGSTNVDLAPGQIKEVHVQAPNCGDATNPDIRPNVVSSIKID